MPRLRRLFWPALVLASWTAFGLLTAAQAQLLAAARGGPQPGLVTLFGPPMLGAWLWALYTPVVAAAARRVRRLREGRGAAAGWVAYLGAHVGVAAAIVAVDVPVWAWIRPHIDGVEMSYTRAAASTLLLNVLGYLSVVTITEAIDYAARWRERQQAAAALERTADSLRRRLDEARLRALESQLRPHFLYNTLNLVAELVHDDPSGADEMLTNLGALLRRSYRDGAQLVPLAEEIGYVRAYAEILARRYGDRVELSFRVPQELTDCAVPAFVLQPLVENAFRHGVERREGCSLVDVVVRADGDALEVRIGDREIGRDWHRARDDDATTPTLSARPEGIGLRNTRERLALLYGSTGRLTLVRTAHESVATVRLPLRHDGAAVPTAVADPAPAALA